MYVRKPTSYKKGKRSSIKVKRTYKKRRTVPAVERMYSMGPRSFPFKAMMNFTYCAEDTITALASTAQRSYRGNAIIDVTGTGAGIIATPYNEVLPIYNRYAVIYSTIEIKVVNNCAAAVQIAIIPYDFLNTVILDPNQWLENPKVKSMWIDGTSKGGQSYGDLSMTCSTQSLVGKSPWVDADVQSQITLTPNVAWFWLVGMVSADHATLVSAFLTVKVTYHTKLDSRLILTT